MQNVYSIAIDGPSGAGKSTVAKRIAEKTGCLYLDTGAMYRAIGLWMLRNNVPIRDADAVRAHVDQPHIYVAHEGGGQRVYLNGEDVSEAIRTPIVSDAASAVSAVPEVRARLVRMQQELAKGRAVVMDGRDIATKVLPDATIKIYLVADVRERARRRQAELAMRGVAQSFDDVLREMQKRDYDDSNRTASPLTRTADAITLDTSRMTPDEAADEILRLLEAREE